MTASDLAASEMSTLAPPPPAPAGAPAAPGAAGAAGPPRPLTWTSAAPGPSSPPSGA